MKTISLKLDDSIFEETEGIVLRLKQSRNRYINEAVGHYNKLQKRKKLEQILQSESSLVKDDSMLVLSEFESLEYEN